MYCIIKCIVQGKQARVINADLRHPSCTVVMQKRQCASPVLNVLICLLIFYLRVSGKYEPIISRKYCTYTTPDICHSIYMTVCYAGRNSALYTRQSSIQSDKYPVSYWYDIFSWWWAHSCPKHVEKINKHVKKIWAPVWFYLQDDSCTSSMWLVLDAKIWFILYCCGKSY